MEIEELIEWEINLDFLSHQEANKEIDEWLKNNMVEAGTL